MNVDQDNIDQLTDYIHKPSGPIGYFVDTTPSKDSLYYGNKNKDLDCDKKTSIMKWVSVGIVVLLVILIIIAIFNSANRTKAEPQQIEPPKSVYLPNSSNNMSTPIQVPRVTFSAPPTFETPIQVPQQISQETPHTSVSTEIRRPAVIFDSEEVLTRSR
jgi:hypothetical protein